MGLISRIQQERLHHILRHARPHLEEGEDVLQWVRVVEPDGKHEGFLYITDDRLILQWTGRHEHHVVLPWPDIRAWGTQPDAQGGPMLAVESEAADFLVQMRVETHGAAHSVSEFLTRFAALAPAPRTTLATVSALGEFHPHDDVSVPRQGKSIAGQTRRVILTVVGILLIVAGILLSLPFVPGPGFLVILFGLGVLSLDWDWAKDARDWLRLKYRNAARRVRGKRRDSLDSEPE